VSSSVRRHRLAAASGVYWLLVVQVLLAGFATVVALVAGLALGVPWIALVPAVLTALAGWVARAWRQERRCSWWVATGLTVLGAGVDLIGLGAGVAFWRLAHLAFDIVLLALLVHPDSVARLAARAPAPSLETPSWHTPSGRHGSGGGDRLRGRP
jgi:hypothetical protein